MNLIFKITSPTSTNWNKNAIVRKISEWSRGNMEALFTDHFAPGAAISATSGEVVPMTQVSVKIRGRRRNVRVWEECADNTLVVDLDGEWVKVHSWEAALESDHSAGERASGVS